MSRGKISPKDSSAKNRPPDKEPASAWHLKRTAAAMITILILIAITSCGGGGGRGPASLPSAVSSPGAGAESRGLPEDMSVGRFDARAIKTDPETGEKYVGSEVLPALKPDADKEAIFSILDKLGYEVVGRNDGAGLWEINNFG